MNSDMRKAFSLSIIVVALCLGLSGCPNRGPAQSAGEKIDRATDKVSDTLNPKGPAEKAGRSIDRALDK